MRRSNIASLADAFSSTVLLTPRASIPTSYLALFATQSKTKSPELILPKKPLSPFFLFRDEKIDNMKKEHPKATFKKLSIILGQMWNDLEEVQRDNYKHMRASAMEEYRNQISAIESDPEMNSQLVRIKEQKTQERVEKAYRKAKKERKSLLENLGKPKRSAPNAFIIFKQETFPSVHKKGDTVANAVKEISEAWNSLSEEQKEPYIVKYNKFQEQYNFELSAWKEKMATNEKGAESILTLNAKVNRKRKLKEKSKEVEE